MAESPTYPPVLVYARECGGRDRLSVGLRLVYLLPHVVWVSAVVELLVLCGILCALLLAAVLTPLPSATGRPMPAQLLALGPIAMLIVVQWLKLVLTGRSFRALHRWTVWGLQWSARLSAYAGLLTDRMLATRGREGMYPFEVLCPFPEGERDRVSVLLRPLLVIPPLVAWALLTVAAVVSLPLAWSATLLTRKYPTRLYAYNLGVWRWTLRLCAYALLVSDAYPGFSLRA